MYITNGQYAYKQAENVNKYVNFAHRRRPMRIVQSSRVQENSQREKEIKNNF